MICAGFPNTLCRKLGGVPFWGGSKAPLHDKTTMQSYPVSSTSYGAHST